MSRGSDRRLPDYSLAPLIVGASAAVRRATSLALRAAASSVKVLITGESGVGKDVLARLIHAQSDRRAQPFVALNCAGLSEPLLETELFGHVKGSFTGAYRDKVGCLERADGGTIFLDEIGDMGPRMQALLLRFLETGELRPVGSEVPPIRVDVRVVSATHRDLFAMVAAGTFREDLFYRINVVHIHVPPLRERAEDVRPLLEHVVAKCGSRLEFTEEALRLLEDYTWPGNIRELHNVVEQLVSLVSGRVVEPCDLPQAIAAGHGQRSDGPGERRRTLADDLYQGLTAGRISFWDDVYPLFMDRDLTRSELRRLVVLGLAASAGSFRTLLTLFRMPQDDYKRLLNFLAAHQCSVESRRMRHTKPAEDPAVALRVRARSG